LAFTRSTVIVSDLYKAYQSSQGLLPVLKGVSLYLEQGQILGIIGRSGAGKSTLLRCLNCLEIADSGDILIGQQSLMQATEQARCEILRKIGTVFQNFNLLSRRTVLQNIALPLEFMGASPDEITVKTQRIAALVGLGDKHHAYPSQLSGGQRQRVAIARALVADVSLLLCDEFTSALDPETSLEILSLLRDLNQRLGVTIVLITHDMSVVREICDQVCVMDDGRIVEAGSVESILLMPQHEVTQSLVSNLFMKDLPHAIHEFLHADPFESDHVVLRLAFSGHSAHQPIIASLIEEFHIPVNIIAGSLDHVREVAFGSLVVTLPGQDPLLSEVLKHFQAHHVAAEILGFIPSP
jgi:D-methionine transport system ATP-binding protein